MPVSLLRPAAFRHYLPSLRFVWQKAIRGATILIFLSGVDFPDKKGEKKGVWT